MLEGLRIKNKKLVLSFILVNLVVAVVGVVKWESLYVPVMRLNYSGLQGVLLANVVLIFGVMSFAPSKSFADVEDEVRLIMWIMLALILSSLSTMLYILISGILPSAILVGMELVLLFNLFGYFTYFGISYTIKEVLKEILNSKEKNN